MRKQLFLIGIIIIFFMTNFNPLALGETSSKIKLHKPKVSVSPPNRQGLVIVRGQPGAVEGTGEAVGDIQVIKPGETFKIAEDGTFHTQVFAESGDKIRVQAKNKAKKKSYGTFTVPAQQEKPSQNQSTTLTIMIVDTKTGKPLASRQLELPAHSKQAAEELLDQCLSHIQQEMATLPNAVKPENKAEKPQGP